jgi:putative transposase
MDLPQRKNIRLKNYDYSQNGYYFITICVCERQELLWESTVGATSGRPPLSSMDEVIDKEINKIPTIYKNVEIEKYVIMPNHIQIIISINNKKWRTTRGSPYHLSHCKIF